MCQPPSQRRAVRVGGPALLRPTLRLRRPVPDLLFQCQLLRRAPAKLPAGDVGVYLVAHRVRRGPRYFSWGEVAMFVRSRDGGMIKCDRTLAKNELQITAMLRYVIGQ